MDDRELEAALDAMRRLTNEGLTEPRARRLAARLKNTATRVKGSWTPWLVTGCVTVAVAVALVALWRSPEPATTRLRYATADVNTSFAPERPATITTGAAGRAAVDVVGRAHLFVGADTQLEVVSRDDITLTRGVASFDVEKIRSGRRFTVRVGGDRVVVHGTRFTVWAANNRLVAVAVSEGVVTVGDGQVATLRAGERWGEDHPSQRDPREDIPASAVSQANAEGVLLELESSPEGAAIALDGAEVGYAPIFIRVGRGELAVRASLPGHVAQERRIVVGESEIAHHTFTLVREATRGAEPAPRRTVRGHDDLWQTAEHQLRDRRCEALERTAKKLAALESNDEARAQGHLMVAECAVRSGATRKALAIFDAVVRDYPKATGAEAALFESGRLLADSGRQKGALERLDAYLQRYPNGAFADPAAFRRCEVLVSAPQHETPLTCVEAYLREHPRGMRHGEAVWLLAELQRASGRFAQAMEHYARARQEALTPDRQEQALYYQIVCAHKAGAATTEELASSYRQIYPEGRFLDAIRELAP